MDWIYGIPTEPGLYWFYGWTKNDFFNGREPKLDELSVGKNATGQLMYVFSHDFAFDGLIGIHQKIEIEEPIEELNKYLQSLPEKMYKVQKRWENSFFRIFSKKTKPDDILKEFNKQNNWLRGNFYEVEEITKIEGRKKKNAD